MPDPPDPHASTHPIQRIAGQVSRSIRSHQARHHLHAGGYRLSVERGRSPGSLAAVAYQRFREARAARQPEAVLMGHLEPQPAQPDHWHADQALAQAPVFQCGPPSLGSVPGPLMPCD